MIILYNMTENAALLSSFATLYCIVSGIDSMSITFYLWVLALFLRELQLLCLMNLSLSFVQITLCSWRYYNWGDWFSN